MTFTMYVCLVIKKGIIYVISKMLISWKKAKFPITYRVIVIIKSGLINPKCLLPRYSSHFVSHEKVNSLIT